MTTREDLEAEYAAHGYKPGLCGDKSYYGRVCALAAHTCDSPHSDGQREWYAPDSTEHPIRGGHPLQPIALDEYGTARFKVNKIVRHLLDFGQARSMGLNELATMGFPSEDWEQFAQLIGYSVGGFSDLSYASLGAIEEANAVVEQLGGNNDPCVTGGDL